MAEQDPLADRVARLEQQVAALMAGGAGVTDGVPAANALDDGSTPAALDHNLRFLHELERAAPQAVMMVGSVDLPQHGPVRWQYAQTQDALVDADWDDLVPAISALAHPLRLAIMKAVITGVESTSDLLENPDLANTGKLHHHLRQLVSAGWLVSAGRGRHHIPPERTIPLLVLLMAARR